MCTFGRSEPSSLSVRARSTALMKSHGPDRPVFPSSASIPAPARPKPARILDVGAVPLEESVCRLQVHVVYEVRVANQVLWERTRCEVKQRRRYDLAAPGVVRHNAGPQIERRSRVFRALASPPIVFIWCGQFAPLRVPQTAFIWLLHGPALWPQLKRIQWSDVPARRLLLVPSFEPVRGTYPLDVNCGACCGRTSVLLWLHVNRNLRNDRTRRHPCSVRTPSGACRRSLPRTRYGGHDLVFHSCSTHAPFRYRSCSENVPKRFRRRLLPSYETEQNGT